MVSTGLSQGNALMMLSIPSYYLNPRRPLWLLSFPRPFLLFSWFCEPLHTPPLNFFLLLLFLLLPFNMSYLEVIAVCLQKTQMSLAYFSISYDSWLQATENPAHDGLNKKRM